MDVWEVRLTGTSWGVEEVMWVEIRAGGIREVTVEYTVDCRGWCASIAGVVVSKVSVVGDWNLEWR